jgi:hypothetical protein
MIAVSSSGKSFRALAWYLANGRSGEEQVRVAWAVGRNLPTSDPELAATFMRATASRSDRVEKPVYHLALSFDPGDAVDRETIERVASRVLDRLGLAEHQAVIIAHRDRGHAHVHVLVNRVHPETGKAWERWQDRPVIQEVLREEERALGLREVAPSLVPPEAHSRGPASRVAQVAELLKTHERVTELKREQSGVQLGAAALRVRFAESRSAEDRARAAEAGFIRALGDVYRDPDAARRAFADLAASRGVAEATSTLREHPERLGKLIAVERPRVLGLVRTDDESQARALARPAAIKGREALDARRLAASAELEVASGWAEDERTAKRIAALETELGRLPRQRELEDRIGRVMGRLLPREIERLRSLVTSPQLAIAQRLKAVARDVVLGRENERG